MTCKARQYSDQMVCAPCDLAWDTNDDDPPPCRDGNAFFPEPRQSEVIAHRAKPDEFDLRPGAVNYVDVPPEGARFIPSPQFVKMSLVEFCELVGIEVGPWQRQFLDELDKQRGIPHKA